MYVSDKSIKLKLYFCGRPVIIGAARVVVMTTSGMGGDFVVVAGFWDTIAILMD